MVRRRLVCTLVVALLAALAGCNTGGAGGTPTLTPVPVTEPAAGSVDGVTLPPGVNSEGLTDTAALLAASDRALAASGYVAETWLNGTAAGDRSRIDPPAPGAVHRVVRVAPGGVPTMLSASRRVGGIERRWTQWANDSWVVVRPARFGSIVARPVRSDRPERSDGVVARPSRTDRAANPALTRDARSVIAVGDYDEVTVQGSGPDARVVVRATGASGAGGTAELAVRAYRGRLVLDRQGRLRSAAVSLVTDDGLTYRLTYDVRRVGDTAVERPRWVRDGIADARADGVEPG